MQGTGQLITPLFWVLTQVSSLPFIPLNHVHPFWKQKRNLSWQAALNFREYLGGEEKINAYCRKLAQDGGKRLAEIMGTEMMSSVSEVTGEDELTFNMVRFSLETASLGVVVPFVLTTGEREATASLIYKIGA
jgi:hypothetical protein